MRHDCIFHGIGLPFVEGEAAFTFVFHRCGAEQRYHQDAVFTVVLRQTVVEQSHTVSFCGRGIQKPLYGLYPFSAFHDSVRNLMPDDFRMKNRKGGTQADVFGMVGEFRTIGDAGRVFRKVIVTVKGTSLIQYRRFPFCVI